MATEPLNSPESDEPKRRGRPKGSKNRPKMVPAATNVAVQVPSADSPAPRVDPLPASPIAKSNLLEQYEETARSLRKALQETDDPKEVASISTTLNRTYWHIGQLTGEATITEQKIVRSEAWKNLLMRMEQIFGKYPEVAAEVAAYLRSLESQ